MCFELCCTDPLYRSNYPVVYPNVQGRVLPGNANVYLAPSVIRDTRQPQTSFVPPLVASRVGVNPPIPHRVPAPPPLHVPVGARSVGGRAPVIAPGFNPTGQVRG